MATTYKKPKYYFDNYLQKAQILFWQFLQSPLLHDNIFIKSQTIYKKPKYYFGNYLQKDQILFRQLFTKSPNTFLANIYKNPILFWRLFTKS